MNYLERILQTQSLLAAAFEPEAGVRLAQIQSGAFFRAGQAQQEKDGGEAPAAAAEEAMRAAADSAAAVEEAAAFYEKWRTALEDTEKISALRLQQQRAVLQEAVSLQKTAAASPTTPAAELFTAGRAQSSLLQSTGIAGYQTGQSMAEISRFFERDARRYGG